MTYASACSGIEAASVAWEPLGWRPAWFSEIEPFPSSVLAHRFPDVPNLGDMTKIRGDEHGTVDLLVGGTPCQDLSVAGKRMGFAGERSVLALDFVRLAYESGARWFVWENVPGIFSSNGGEDFAQLLSLFAGWQVDVPADGWGSFGIVEQSPGCFGLAWRVLDVQYARVDGFPRAIPQRRRRVFVVGYLGDWRPAAQVLFEPEGLLGNTPPRREAGKGAADGAERGVAHSLRAQSQCSFREDTETIVFDARGNGDADVCPTVTGDHAGRPTDYTPVICLMDQGGQTMNVEHDKTGTLRAQMNRHAPIVFDARGNGDADVCPTVTGDHAGRPTDYTPVVCRKDATGLVVSFGAKMSVPQTDVGLMQTLQATNPMAVTTHGTVRRLVPIECERLMGFPDNFTRIPWRGKPAEECPDGPRYKACGNSMGVNVMRWIGTRIQAVEDAQ